ncbi:MAG TPA: M20/M25/M40 family metallo-hydrolase [Candidatus Kapabacteria bacterium]|nr:M20/M25/M40 family metallo-hydrolase [Candidatus Kapabacteria bacterium]
MADSILHAGLSSGKAAAMLSDLTGSVGARLSGSPGAERAVEWARATMRANDLDNVHLQSVMVPHWVRGSQAEAAITNTMTGDPIGMHACALGGSIGTPIAGIEGDVIEVKSLDEAAKLGAAAQGKIIFFNRPMDPTLSNTFEAYGRAVDQRVSGVVAAGRIGAVAVLVRSMSTSIDTLPHTGMLRYDDSVTKVPAVAISTLDADRLSAMLASRPTVHVRLRLDCQTLPDVESANVIGEIEGSEKSSEVIVLGAHLDSWDLATGAHDDGAGCAQVLEALRLLKALKLRPKRTIRVVLFMNEENGLRGATAYASQLNDAREKHIAAIESDRGGFAPRGFEVEGEDADVARLARWAKLFEAMGAERFSKGESGADVGPLKKHGALTIGLIPESQRYFDYHHAASDTFSNVNPRELELGSTAMALLAYLISEEGL